MYLIEKPLRYVLIDDFYDESELKHITGEVSAFAPYAISGSEDQTSSNGDKTGSGLRLDEMFIKNRHKSKVLSLNQKLFAEPIYSSAITLDASFSHLKTCSSYSTFLNYYKNGEEYKPHFDGAALTAITFLKFGEFTGGDFKFTDYDETVPIKHNRTVIFPSCVMHQSTSIQSSDDSYKASITQFLWYVTR